MQNPNDQLLERLFTVVIERLRDRGIAFEYSDDIPKFIAKKNNSHDSRSDALQLDQLFHKLIANPLEQLMLDISVKNGDSIFAKLLDDRIEFSVTPME